MDIEFNDAYQERLQKSNQALLDAYDALDPSSPTYYEDLVAVSKMAEQINDDYKNYADVEAEAIRSDLETERNKTEKKANLFRNVIGIGGLAVTLITFFVGERNRNARIDKVAKFEEDNAILKSSEKIAVSDSIREDRKPLSLPFFGK